MRMWFLRQTVLHPDTATSHHWEFFCILRKLWSRGTSRMLKQAKEATLWHTLSHVDSQRASFGTVPGLLTRISSALDHESSLYLYNCGHHEHEHYRSFVQHQQCTLFVFSLELRVRAWLTTISWFMWFQRENYLFLGFDQHCTSTDWNWNIWLDQPQTGTENNHNFLDLCSFTHWWLAQKHHVSLCLVQFHCFVENTELSVVALTRSLRLDFHCVCLDHFQQKIWVIWLDQPQNGT